MRRGRLILIVKCDMSQAAVINSAVCVSCICCKKKVCESIAYYYMVSPLDAVIHECRGWNCGFSLSEGIGRCNCVLTLMHTTFLPSGEKIALNTG